jgi:hypothetical protein
MKDHTFNIGDKVVLKDDWHYDDHTPWCLMFLLFRKRKSVKFLTIDKFLGMHEEYLHFVETQQHFPEIGDCHYIYKAFDLYKE